ncbi:hypothetical protein ASPZODRAFT_100245 [Penicilliopsis zonata CBS 506.65]|uniref:AB hydrolase-1 domain-containing protein n=1 Tax=Penicilliopsis zonata CBS 506.65 TaxID=1073090 RepID=A0A1L9SCY3_9EURO|nr:hypothetical protein ASPZODRAFT_100245 [Penicilliopsis zonata CBS 506.65]OJJ45080.1 hypothetical protein ASPZODRAFT_100245 [Penicilliopsis zonata CBS 506.65]
MTQPTVVLVPGAWLTHAFYAPFLSLLERQGFPVHYAEYPSLDAADPSSASCQVDSDAILAHTVRPLIQDQGRDVLVLMHSYGAMCGSAAVASFSKTDRARRGQNGGVLALICLGAFLVPEGLSCAGFMGGSLPPWILLEEASQLNTVEDMTVLSADVQNLENIRTQLKPHATLAFNSPQPTPAFAEEAFRDRLAVILLDGDRAVPLFAQEGMVRGTGKTWIVKRMEGSSHLAPFAERMDECVCLIEEIRKLLD